MTYRSKLIEELTTLERRKVKLWIRFSNKATCSGQKQVLKVITGINAKYQQVHYKLYGSRTC